MSILTVPDQALGLVPMYGNADVPGTPTPEEYGDLSTDASNLLGNTGGGSPILLLGLGGLAALVFYKFGGKKGLGAKLDKHFPRKSDKDEDNYGDEDEDDESDEDEAPKKRVKLRTIKTPKTPSPKDLPEISLEGLRRTKGTSGKGRFADATTDSLLDEAAVIAGRGHKGDCYKAVKLLKGRSGLVKTPREKGLYARVARAVSKDCAHAEHEIEQAVTEELDKAEEVDSIFSKRGNGRTRPDIEEATKLWLELDPDARSGEVERELRSDEDPEIEYEENLRPVKGRSSLRKTRVEHGDARSKGRSHGGRPGAGSIKVKKTSGATYKIKKEKAKTKRGYTWRKEN